LKTNFIFKKEKRMYFRKVIPVFILASLLLAACGGNSPATSSDRLKVVASTNIVGDVVAQVGDDLIDLTVLFPPGTDPHTFDPRPKDIAAISDADVVIIQGLGLESTLESALDANVTGALVHAAEGVDVLGIAGEAHDEHEGEDHEEGDPHTWTDPSNVIIWTQNIVVALSQADPDHAPTYQANAQAYIAELRALDSWIRAQVETIPAGQRQLVTDHLSFGYFAHEYGFEQVGLVVAALSTNAAPSAKEIAELIDAIEEHHVPAIFVGNTVNPALAEQVAEDTGAQVVFLYTGSLSERGGEADSYIKFMRYNVNEIVEVLK
jgi:ABC-type Zn uptake system ZnuABC Zn-binding protein ZnuA